MSHGEAVPASIELWEKLAQQLQQEKDPQKLICVAKQLIEALDEKTDHEKSSRYLPRTVAAA